MKSWKTTVGGALSAIGISLSTVKDPVWVSTLGTVLAATGTALMGLCARDNGVTSEQAGAAK